MRQLYLSYLSDAVKQGRGGLVKSSKNKLSVRLPQDLLDALERERLRMGRAAGVQVNTSAVVRAILEKEFARKKKTRATSNEVGVSP